MPRKEDYWKNPDKFRKATRAYAVANPEWKRRSNAEWAATPQGQVTEKAKQRRYRERLTPEQKAEKAEYQKQWFAKNPGYSRDKLAEERARDPRRLVVAGAKHRAEQLGVPFDLDWRQIQIPEFCPVLNIPLRTNGLTGIRGSSPSIDRLIPALGYVHSNIRIISMSANAIKKDKTLDELRGYAEGLRWRLENALMVIAYVEREGG